MYTQIFENVFLKIFVPLIFILEFPGFSVKWFAFRKFHNLQILWNLSQEISVPFVPVLKISDFFVEWKAPRDFYEVINF